MKRINFLRSGLNHCELLFVDPTVPCLNVRDIHQWDARPKLVSTLERPVSKAADKDIFQAQDIPVRRNATQPWGSGGFERHRRVNTARDRTLTDAHLLLVEQCDH